VEVWQTSHLRPLRLGEEIKKEEERKKQDENIYGLPYYIGRPKITYTINKTFKHTDMQETQNSGTFCYATVKQCI